jgi:UDP-glucose 4-epimerase
MSKPKILITGGTGLVGTALLNRLSKGDFDISVLYRNPIPGNHMPSNWIPVNYQDPLLDLQSLFAGVDVLIHNAASLKIGNTPEEISEIKAFNYEFTERLFVCAGVCNVKKIILTSSLSLLEKPLPEIITEESKTNPISYYSKSKYFAEEMLVRLAKEFQFEYSILRISSPVSKMFSVMPQTVLQKWINDARSGTQISVFGKGTRSQDFVSVDDIAEAFYLCIITSHESGIFNIASGNTLSMKELAKMISQKFNAGFSFSGSDQNESDIWNVSIDKAARELGYAPRFTSSSCIQYLLNSL